MIEHAIDDHTYTAFVRRIEKIQEEQICRCPGPCVPIHRILLCDEREVAFRIRTEVRIYVMKAVSIILVHRPRIEDRVEIDDIDAQIRQIIQLIDHPLQIAAVAPMEDTVVIEIRAEFLLPFVARIPVGRPRRDAPVLRRHDRRLE